MVCTTRLVMAPASILLDTMLELLTLGSTAIAQMAECDFELLCTLLH